MKIAIDYESVISVFVPHFMQILCQSQRTTLSVKAVATLKNGTVTVNYAYLHAIESQLNIGQPW